MDLLADISPFLQSASSGRALLTCWSGEGYPEAKAFQERLNLDLTICCGAEHLDPLGQHNLKCVQGDLIGDMEGSHRQFSILIVPGPDIVAAYPSNTPDSFQREYRHVKMSEPYLAHGGILVFQTEKSRVLEFPTWVANLVKGYANLSVFDDGKNILFVGTRRTGIAPLDKECRDQIMNRIIQDDLPRIQTAPKYRIPKISLDRRTFFRSRYFDPRSVDAVMRSIPWGGNKIRREIEGWHQPVIKPAFRLRARHLAYVVASGVLGTIEVISPTTGDPCIIRGVMRREEIASQTVQEGEDMLRSNVRASIILFNLTQRSISVVDPENATQIKAFLDEWAEVLIRQIEDHYPVVYDPVGAPYYECFHPHLTKLIDRPLRDGTINLTSADKPGLTIPQRHVVATALRCLLGRRVMAGNLGEPEDTGAKSFFLQGKPGVGKSIMAARIIEGITLDYAHRHHFKVSQTNWPVSVIVTVPGVINEMVDEVKKASRLLEPRIVSNVSQLMQALAEVKHNPRPLVLIIPRSVLSQSQVLSPAFRKGNPEYHDAEQHYPVMLCPNCYDLISCQVEQFSYGRQREMFLTPEDLVKHPRNIRTRGKKCPTCEAPLWQETRRVPWVCGHCGHELVLDHISHCPQCRNRVNPIPNSPYQVGSVIKKAFKKAGVKPLVFLNDEVHQDKSAHSTRGQAMAWFADLFEKVLGMTGTLYGGKHSTLFHLLYRMLPEFRVEWGVDDESAFVQRYANWAKYWVDERFDRMVELPGISPMVMAGILLNHTIFLTLEDAGFALPSRTDIPVFVEMGEDEAAGSRALLQEVRAKVETEGASQEKRVSVSGADLAKLQIHPVGMHLPQMAIFSPGWKCPKCGEHHSHLGLCRHNWQSFEIAEGQFVEEQSVQVIPEFDSNWKSRKEQVLIDLVKRENEEGRPCLVYVWNTGRQYRIDQRLETLLCDAGVQTFNASRVPARVIQQRILASTHSGTQAVLVNPIRVGTGTNLVHTPSIIFYQPVWSVYTAAQAASRAHRPTQTQDVRVYWMIYAGTVEEVILSKIIEKMVVSEYVAGGDTDGYAEVMEAVGHVETFEEAVFNHIRKFADENVGAVLSHHKVGLTDLVGQLNEVRGQTGSPGIFEQIKAREILEEKIVAEIIKIDLTTARQLSFL